MVSMKRSSVRVFKGCGHDQTENARLYHVDAYLKVIVPGSLQPQLDRKAKIAFARNLLNCNVADV